MKYSSYLFIIIVSMLISCRKADDFSIDNEKSRRPFFTSFALLKDNNKNLTRDYVGVIYGDSLITIFCPELTESDSLVPSFYGNYSIVTVGSEVQTSGTDFHNFNNTIRYDLMDSLGNTASYNVQITVLNGLPMVEIETEGLIPVLSKTENIKASIKISNCPEYGVIESSGKIRGRGNFTWERYPKKPYKIKFSEKKSPFGFAANKDWVLMAEYLDHSLLRTAYMCEVSKAVGVSFTSNYQYVDFFLNREYQGTYIFADFIEKAKHRINIENDGYIIECDNRWYEEPLSFPSSINIPASVRNGGEWVTRYYTFKYPDATDREILEGDDRFNFITNYMYDFENSVSKLMDDPLDTTFLDYIDTKSFAKWFISTEVLANIETNYYFVLNSRNSKLEMYPLWDCEWSLGLWSLRWGNAPDLVERRVAETMLYFPYLLKSPIFVETLKQEWRDNKDRVISVPAIIEDIIPTISLSQQGNFQKWKVVEGNQLNVTFDTWEGELDYVNQFFKQRVTSVDKYIEAL